MNPELQNMLEQFNRLNGSDRYFFRKLLQLDDGRNIQVGVSTGTKIGTASTQKLALWGATPVVQAGAISSPAANVNDLKTAVDAIRTAIKNAGITA